MRYRVNFRIEGAVEVTASSEEEAEEIVEGMERGDLFKVFDFDEQGFSAAGYEMSEEE
jgi:hypothetical protein